MKVKKFTVSKIVLFIPYILACVVLGLMIYAVIKEYSFSYLAPLEATFAVIIAICGYITKWYLKKSALENEPKIRLGIMQEMVKLQRENPDMNIYDKTQIRADADSIVKPIKMDEQSQYENMIKENTDTKIQ